MEENINCIVINTHCNKYVDEPLYKKYFFFNLSKFMQVKWISI